MLAEKWDQILTVRAEVISRVAESRQSGQLGSSLEAHPIVRCSPQLGQILASVDMAEVTVTSAFDVIVNQHDELSIVIEKAKGKRCAKAASLKPESRDSDRV